MACFSADIKDLTIVLKYGLMFLPGKLVDCSNPASVWLPFAVGQTRLAQELSTFVKIPHAVAVLRMSAQV